MTKEKLIELIEEWPDKVMSIKTSLYFNKGCLKSLQSNKDHFDREKRIEETIEIISNEEHELEELYLRFESYKLLVQLV